MRFEKKSSNYFDGCQGFESLFLPSWTRTDLFQSRDAVRLSRHLLRDSPASQPLRSGSFHVIARGPFGTLTFLVNPSLRPAHPLGDLGCEKVLEFVAIDDLSSLYILALLIVLLIGTVLHRAPKCHQLIRAIPENYTAPAPSLVSGPHQNRWKDWH